MLIGCFFVLILASETVFGMNVFSAKLLDYQCFNVPEFRGTYLRIRNNVIYVGDGYCQIQVNLWNANIVFCE